MHTTFKEPPLPSNLTLSLAAAFAVSVAAAFNAHLAGIAFVYEPIIPVMIDMYGIPPT